VKRIAVSFLVIAIVSVPMSAVSPVGLIAHWPLDGSGLDVSGNGNNLTVSNASTGADRFGVANTSLELEASSTSLSLADGPGTDLTSQFTWAGWVRFDRIGTDNDNFVAKSCCSANSTTMFYADTYAWDGSHPNYNQIRFFVTAGGGNFGFEQAGPLLQNHHWYHVALVYDGPASTMMVYVNGQLTNGLTNTGAGGINDVPSSLNNVDAPFTMGRIPEPGPTGSMQGALDDVWWVSRPLSAAEIAELASQTSCETQIIGLQSQVDSLAAQVNQLQGSLATTGATIQSLQSQIGGLNQQNAQLQSQVSTLTQQIQSVNSGLQLVEADLRSTFNSSTFTIAGSTTNDRYDSLITAILALSKGQLQALYKNMGGK